MHYLYVLESKKCGRRYIGISEKPDGRLEKHNLGGVKSTRAYKPWVRLYLEKFPSRVEARKMEKFYKTHASAREELFAKINTGVIV